LSMDLRARVADIQIRQGVSGLFVWIIVEYAGR